MRVQLLQKCVSMNIMLRILEEIDSSNGGIGLKRNAYNSESRVKLGHSNLNIKVSITVKPRNKT